MKMDREPDDFEMFINIVLTILGCAIAGMMIASIWN